MALETGTYLSDLVTTNPVGATDKVKFGDDHIRLIKTVLKNTFPNLGGRAFREQSKGADYTVATTDNLTFIACTTALTLSPDAAATLGNGHLFFVITDGGAVTVDPNASETINGAATLTIPDGSFALISCDGTQFYAFVMELQLATVTQAEAEAGTDATRRVFTPERVGQAIAALAPSSDDINALAILNFIGY